MHKDLAPGKRAIRVLVADSSRIHTQLLADALKRDHQLEVVPFASGSSSLVGAVMAQGVDVLLISSSLDEMPSRGFEVLRELRAANPGIRAVVLLDSSKDEAILNAFRAGARGVVSKSQPVEILSRCLRSVHQGQIWANSREMAIAVDALASAPALRSSNTKGMSLLSKRELQVVHSLAEGLTNKEIAEQLGLSQHTVKNYLFRVFDKMGVSSRMELLFMTLSHQSPAGSEDVNKAAALGSSPEDFAFFQKAAEAGLPAAQLTLAQMYLARRANAEDLVQAYVWYLVATERAQQAEEIITRMMTPKQIEEAQQQATAWLARLDAASRPVPDSLQHSKSVSKARPEPARS